MSLTGFNKSDETHLWTTPSAELNDAVSRHRVASSSNVRIRQYSKNVSGTCRPSLAQCVYEIRSTKLLLLRKRPITNKDVWCVRKALRKHFETFRACEILFNPRVHHVASKLSEFYHIYERKLYHSWMLLRTQMSSGCAFEANLLVTYYLIFRTTDGFSLNGLCYLQMHKDAR